MNVWINRGRDRRIDRCVCVCVCLCSQGLCACTSEVSILRGEGHKTGVAKGVPDTGYSSPT